MVSRDIFTLKDILAVAKIHPFYAFNANYPPDASTIQTAREDASEDAAESDLKLRSPLWKSTL